MQRKALKRTEEGRTPASAAGARFPHSPGGIATLVLRRYSALTNIGYESGVLAIPRKPGKQKVKAAVRIQYGALPYRFTADAELEVLLVTTRRSRRWIIPKGWPIKGLKPPKSAAREAFEEAGVRGKVGAKALGLFTYDKVLDEAGIQATCEVKVYPLLVKSQSEDWPESAQRIIQWVEPSRAVALIKEPDLKELVAAFAERVIVAAAKPAY